MRNTNDLTPVACECCGRDLTADEGKVCAGCESATNRALLRVRAGEQAMADALARWAL